MSSMIRPIPRDSLGRIVYKGDVYQTWTDGVRLDGVVTEFVCCSCVKVYITPLRFTSFPSNIAPIDLAASPDRTNYERYFGISPYDCIAFIRWLYEKAVV